jgi:hypothetical protein
MSGATVQPCHKAGLLLVLAEASAGQGHQKREEVSTLMCRLLTLPYAKLPGITLLQCSCTVVLTTAERIHACICYITLPASKYPRMQQLIGLHA